MTDKTSAELERCPRLHLRLSRGWPGRTVEVAAIYPWESPDRPALHQRCRHPAIVGLLTYGLLSKGAPSLAVGEPAPR